MRLNRDSYNKIADQWAESRNNSFLSELVLSFAVAVKPGGKILDIGCGTGFPIAQYLSEQKFVVTGIDFSEKLLQKAIDRKLPGSKFYLYDFFDFEPNDYYDGIIAFDSFFHFPREKQKLIYQRVSDWINVDGYLLFTHINLDKENQSEMFGEMFYYSSLSKNETYLLLSDAGFDIVWVKEMYTERDMDRDLVILARKTKRV